MNFAHQSYEPLFCHDRKHMQGPDSARILAVFRKNRQKTVDCGLNLLYAVQPSQSFMFTTTDV